MPVTEFTSWTPDHAYVGTFNITNASASDNWKFTIHDVEPGIIYKLYSVSDADVKATNTSTTDVILTTSNLSNGQYYILQMIPNIDVTKYDPNNVSNNIEFILSESTIATNISYTLNNVTVGRIYKIYDPTSLRIFGSDVADANNATINVYGLENGVYRVAEVGAENIILTYWNQSNATCNGILSLTNTTPVSNINITITSSGPTSRYVLYTMPEYQSIAQTFTNSLNLTNMSDGEYRIARVGTERILFSYFNLSNESCNGIFSIANSTPFSNLNILIHNVTRGMRYSVIDPTNNDSKGSALGYIDTNISVYGLEDGTYWIIHEYAAGVISYVVPTLVAASLIIPTVVSASLLYRRRRSKD